MKPKGIPSQKEICFLFRYLFLNFFFLFRNEIKITWLEGAKLLLRKGDAALVGNYYFKLADFNDSLFLAHFLRNSDTLIDVGANLGHYSILASKVVEAQVISFEPVPSTFKQFEKIIALNKLDSKILTHNVGLADTEGQLWFSSDKNNMNRVVDEHYPNAQKVPVKTLDSLVSVEKVALLKIDVEGFEKFVLDGSKRLLENQFLKAIIIELNGSGLKYGIDENIIHNNLLRLDFHPCSYDATTRTLHKLDSKNKNSFNTIYVRDMEFVLGRLKSCKNVKIGNYSF